MICSSDLHITDERPRCRVDDWMATVEKKLRFVLEYSKQSPPLLIAGDFFDKARSDPWLEQYLISLFKEYNIEIICALGQHDILYHSLKQIDNSSIKVLESAGVINILTKDKSPIIHTNGWAIWGCAYGEIPDKDMFDKQRKNLLIWHQMIIKDEPLWPGQIADKAPAILRKYPQFDLIVTGDNHQTFVERETVYDKARGPRLLINPGAMMRMEADEIDRKPCVFRYENKKIEQVFLPIEDNVMDIDYLRLQKAKDERIATFVQHLKTQYKVTLSFRNNLTQYFLTNNTDKETQELIWSCCKE